jgi:hypothetical protein
MIDVSGSGPRTNRSEFGRPKNIRIRIRNTATTFYREKIMRRAPRELAWRRACQLEWREWRPLSWPPPCRPAPPRNHEMPAPTKYTFHVFRLALIGFVNNWPPGG